ncbi:YciI family protein [Phenylobacterium montanum]|uniref:YciI family protein n=1 Tax=Phenylobacterium montanum TaxID=2823693 RepID=A0A975FXW5_9CAUL|nr:YciI family protein [Caulobacter sp. S6]QUD86994.1 YciI family protein [Caulobacter sp. S6]
MALFVLTCLDKAGALDLRMATREAHLAYVRENLRRIKVAGPLLDAAEQMKGSMFVIEAENAAEVEAFSAADPYRTAGLFESVTVQPWRVTVGGFA